MRSKHTKETQEAFIKLINSSDPKTQYDVLNAICELNVPDYIEAIEKRMEAKSVSVITGMLRNALDACKEAREQCDCDHNC